MHFVDSLNIHAFTKCVWALPSTGVQRYGTSNELIETGSGLSVPLSEMASGHRTQTAYGARSATTILHTYGFNPIP